jgi:anti-sigma factor RsiW
MKCEEVHRLLDIYLDGELDFTQRLEVEQHLAGCPSCRSLIEEHREFRTFFVANVGTYESPPRLEAKVRAALRQEQAKARFSLFLQPWIYATAIVLVAAFVALNILFPGAENQLSQQAVLLHSNSLSTEHLVDVASPDPKIVKPWLTARLDFAPPVVGSPASGYSLVGGRVDVIQNRSVATLIYKNDKDDKDVVTLFCWPPKKDRLSDTDHSIEGHRVSTWSTGQCNYILVSKLNSHAMDEFVDSFRVQIQSGAYF